MNAILRLQQRVTPLNVGLLAGILAVSAQALFGVSPPPAYGLCIACHTRDLINWTVNTLFNTRLGVAPISQELPLLTTLGIVIGAAASAARRGEFKLRTTVSPMYEFVLGMLIMFSALTLGACPMRTVLRVAYGDLTALLGFFSIVAGTVIGSIVLKRSVRL